MRKSIFSLLTGLLFVSSVTGQFYENQPKIISSTPQFGACNVDTNLNKIIIEFDQDMRNSWSIMGSHNMAPILGSPVWTDSRTVEISLDKLESNKVYDLSLNSFYYRNFVSTDNKPMNPTYIIFHTASNKNQHNTDSVTNKVNYESFVDYFLQRYSYKTIKGLNWEEKFGSEKESIIASKTRNEFSVKVLRALWDTNDEHLKATINGTDYGTTDYKLTRFSFNFEAVGNQLINKQSSADEIVYSGIYNNTGYINITSLTSPNAMEFAVEKLIEMKDMPYLIIDLRANGGGGDNLAKYFISMLISSAINYEKIYTFNETSNAFDDMYIRTVNPDINSIKYKGKFIVLTGGKVGSSAESFTLMFKQVPNAVIVGNSTHGSTANPKPFKITDELTVYIPSWIAYDMDDNLIEGNGIAPDVFLEYPEAQFTVADPIFDYVVNNLEELGVNEQGMVAENGLNVYPNPVQDELFVEFKAPSAGQVIISLLDITGNVLFSYSFYSAQDVTNEFKIAVNDYHLSAGIYLLSVHSGALVRTGKVIVQ